MMALLVASDLAYLILVLLVLCTIYEMMQDLVVYEVYCQGVQFLHNLDYDGVIFSALLLSSFLMQIADGMQEVNRCCTRFGYFRGERKKFPFCSAFRWYVTGLGSFKPYQTFQ